MKQILSKSGLVLLFALLCSQIVIAQTTIKGRVTADDGAAIPGVNVVVKGTTRGVNTNPNGEYQINAKSGEILIFSSIGFASKEALIGNQTSINVQLAASDQTLNEVVVTALGISQEKKALGYSVQSLSSKTIEESGENNLVAALQGKVAGAIITGSGGAPGAGVNIILRGITSLSSGSDNQPLFVVDGIIISNSTNSGNPLPSAGTNSPGASEQFANTNRGADINPDDIENVSILKGPAATALYGLRASNGAIVISTKRGKSGKLSVSLNASVGIDNVAKSPAIQTRFIQGRLGEFIPEDDPAQRSIFRSFGPAIGGTNEKIYDNFRDFYTTGVRQNYNLTLTKGNEKGNIYFSLGRNFQSGIIPYSTFGRNSVKIAGAYNLSKKIELSGSINYVNSGGNRPPAGDKSVFSSLSYWPNSYDVNDYIKPDGSQNNITLGVVDNPLYLLRFSPRVDNNNRIIADVNLKYKIKYWLTAKYQLTLDTYKENRTRFVDSTFDVGTQVKGWMTKEDLTFREINSNFYLTANKKLSTNWDGSMMVGNSVVDSRRPDSYFERGEGWKSPWVQDVSSFKNYTKRPYSPGVSRIVSFFGDVKLSYKDILYFNITGRNDMVSTLPVQNNSFFYPSASMSYVFTEHLAPNNNFLSFGKIRLSWAQVGKGTSPYVTSLYYDISPNFPFGGTVDGYRRLSTTADPDLRPERTTSTEIGTELRFFKNRFTIDATYFTADSKDQIVNAPVTNASGYSRYFTNIGLIRNSGVELTVTARPIVAKNFKWETTINYSKTQGTVVEMPPALEEIVYFDNGITQLKVRQGSKLGDLWGFDYRRAPDGQTIIAANGFPVVDLTKSAVFGNALPNFIAGFNNSFDYKGLRLAFLLEWRAGGNVVDLAEVNSIRNGVTALTGQRYERVIMKGVTETINPDKTVSYAPNTNLVVLDDNFYRTASRATNWQGFNIQDGSWFRLRSLNLSYGIPKAKLAKSPFGVVRFTFTGTNLFINTPFRGYDPEALSFGSGTNLIGYVGRNAPSTRSFQFGVNLSLK